MKKNNRHRSSIFVYALGLIFSLSIWLFYFASVAYARDCPPNDPSRSDCAAAAQTAENPAVPAAGTIAGTGTSIAIDRRRKRPGPAMKPPREYGGRTNVWDPPIDEQQNKWEKEGLVWDPQDLTWRPPKPGEIPPPPDAPENPPPYQKEHPREKVPVDCLELYDAYVKQQAKVIAMEDKIKFASEAQFDAQLKFNQLLAKFTLKLGWDVGDTVLLAVGVAHLTVALGQIMTKYLPRTLAEALESAQGLLRRASSKVSELGSSIADLFRNMASKSQIAQALREAADALMSKASSLRRLLTSAEKEAEELANLEGKAAQAADDARVASSQLGKASKEISDLTEKIAERQGAEAAFNRLQNAQTLWKQAFDEQLRIQGQLGKAEEQLAERVDDIRKAAFQKLNEFENQFERILDNGTQAQIAAMRAQRNAVANECQQAFEAGKAAARNELVKPLEGQYNAIREKVIPLGEERMKAIEAIKRFSEGPDLLNTPPRIVSQFTEEALQQALHVANQDFGRLSARVDELAKAADEARKAYDAMKTSAAAAIAALPQYRQDAPNAEADANEAERKAQQAKQDADDAKAKYDKAQSDLNAAKQDELAAQQNVDNLQAQANQEIKNKFAETPQEVATILINARDDVKRIVDTLKELNAERDKLMDDLRWLKPKLDACIEEHTPWGGPSGSNN